jgi:hypothetical protein
MDDSPPIVSPWSEIQKRRPPVLKRAKKTLMSLLQLALVDQQAESEANDPIPEEGGISVRLVSLTARPRHKRGEALESLDGRAGRSGYAGSIREPLDVTSKRRMATAVPISTFKVQYAGEGLTVSKYAHRAVKLSSPALAAMASSVMLF